MTSTKQIAANQKNALKSTGPKTPEGKATVSLNAMKHGLLTKQVLLSDEKESELIEFAKPLRQQLHPLGETENLLAERIIANAWRLRRILKIEVEILNEERTDFLGESVSLGMAFTRACNGADVFSKISRYEAMVERSLYKAVQELERLQANRKEIIDANFTAPRKNLQQATPEEN